METERLYEFRNAEGFQNDSSRNRFQLIWLVAGAGVGVVTLFIIQVQTDSPWWIVPAGAVPGAVLGTLISGFWLMLHPPAARLETMRQFGDRITRQRRRRFLSGIAGAIFYVSGAASFLILGPKSNSSVATIASCCVVCGWILLAAGKTLALSLHKARCPHCGGSPLAPSALCSHGISGDNRGAEQA